MRHNACHLRKTSPRVTHRPDEHQQDAAGAEQPGRGPEHRSGDGRIRIQPAGPVDSRFALLFGELLKAGVRLDFLIEASLDYPTFEGNRCSENGYDGSK